MERPSSVPGPSVVQRPYIVTGPSVYVSSDQNGKHMTVPFVVTKEEGPEKHEDEDNYYEKDCEHPYSDDSFDICWKWNLVLGRAQYYTLLKNFFFFNIQTTLYTFCSILFMFTSSVKDGIIYCIFVRSLSKMLWSHRKLRKGTGTLYVETTDDIWHAQMNLCPLHCYTAGIFTWKFLNWPQEKRD